MWRRNLIVIFLVASCNSLLEHVDDNVDVNDIFVKDGILVQPGETVYEVKAVYELLICISKPEKPLLVRWFNYLERVLSDDTLRSFVSEDIIRQYKSKLNRLFLSRTLTSLVEKKQEEIPSGSSSRGRSRKINWNVVNNTRTSRSTENFSIEIDPQFGDMGPSIPDRRRNIAKRLDVVRKARFLHGRVYSWLLEQDGPLHFPREVMKECEWNPLINCSDTIPNNVNFSENPVINNRINELEDLFFENSPNITLMTDYPLTNTSFLISNVLTDNITSDLGSNHHNSTSFDDTINDLEESVEASGGNEKLEALVNVEETYHREGPAGGVETSNHVVSRRSIHSVVKCQLEENEKFRFLFDKNITIQNHHSTFFIKWFDKLKPIWGSVFLSNNFSCDQKETLLSLIVNISKHDLEHNKSNNGLFQTLILDNMLKNVHPEGYNNTDKIIPFDTGFVEFNIFPSYNSALSSHELFVPLNNDSDLAVPLDNNSHVPKVTKIKHIRKRAIFGSFISKAFKSLFGFSTNDDVKKIKGHADQLKEQNKVIIHNQKDLLSAFNKSALSIHEMDTNIKNLFLKMGGIEQTTRMNLDATNVLLKKVSGLELMASISENLDQLQEVITDYKWRYDIFQRSKTQLSYKVLTESMLPRNILEDTLAQLRGQNFLTMAADWYYYHGRVTKVFNDNNTVIYTLELHGLDSTKYTAYRFNTFPISVARNSTRMFILKPEIAFDSIAGVWFIPYISDCIGGSETLCRVRKKHVAPCCETTILSRTKKLSEECKVRFSHKEDVEVIKSYLPSKFRSNLILNALQPAILTLHCGQSPRSIRISGIYRAHLKPGCSIALRDKWIISQILTLSREISLEAPRRLDLPFLNITWPTHMNISSKIDESIMYKPLTISLLEVPKLQGFEKWSDKFTSRSALLGYVVAFICGFMALITILVLRKLGYLGRCMEFCVKQKLRLKDHASDAKVIESTLDSNKPSGQMKERTVLFQRNGLSSEPTVTFLPSWEGTSGTHSIDHKIKPSEVPEAKILAGPPMTIYPKISDEN